LLRIDYPTPRTSPDEKQIATIIFVISGSLTSLAGAAPSSKKAVDPDDLAMMRRIDGRYLAAPFYASRPMLAVLRPGAGQRTEVDPKIPPQAF
jgi:hypothetical protein